MEEVIVRGKGIGFFEGSKIATEIAEKVDEGDKILKVVFVGGVKNKVDDAVLEIFNKKMGEIVDIKVDEVVDVKDDEWKRITKNIEKSFANKDGYVVVVNVDKKYSFVVDVDDGKVLDVGFFLDGITKYEKEKEDEEEDEEEKEEKEEIKKEGEIVPPEIKSVEAEYEEKDVNGVIKVEKFKPEEYIPRDDDPDIEGYFERERYIKILEFCEKNRLFVLLIGEAGVGKSTLAKYYAWKKKKPFLAVSADSQLSVRELFGTIHLIGASSYFLEGVFLKMCQVPSVILIDEITAIDPSKNFLFHQILASREFFVKDYREKGRIGKTFRLHPDCFIVFAGNPPNLRYIGVDKLNIAFLDRLCVVEVEHLDDNEIKMALEKFLKLRGMSLKKETFDLIKSLNKEIRSLIIQKELRAQFTLRTMQKIALMIEGGWSVEDAVRIAFYDGVKNFDPDDAETIKAQLKLLGINL